MSENIKKELPLLIFQDQTMDKETFLKSCAGINQAFDAMAQQVETVAVIMEKSMELIVSMYACFLYGYPFIPVDPKYPDERIQEILQDINPSVILTDETNQERLKENGCLEVKAFLQKTRKEYEANPVTGMRGLRDVAVTDTMRSTIYFTSGTTGKPKGVIVKKSGQLTHIKGMAEYIPFETLKQSVCLTSISFDLFFDQSILPLYYGLSLVIATEQQAKDPRKLAQLFQKQEIDEISVTPSRLNLLLSYDKELDSLKKVSCIMVGGEKCPESLLHTLQKDTTAKIFNMYGPTEASVYAAISNLTSKEAIDIGKPLPDYEIYILDGEHRMLSEGNKGEIAIGGKGLAEGYVNLPELTGERFVSLPEQPDKRVYLTGDIGMEDADHTLHCFGRLDNQVKFRGFRIELEEIEAVTNAFPGMKESLTKIISMDDGTDLLALWYTGEEVKEEELRKYWSAHLPAYMVPSRIYHLEKFCYTPHGKLDRNAEYAMDKKTAEEPQQEEVFSELEQKIVDTIKKYIEGGSGVIGKSTVLSSLGIDSLKYVRILVDLEEQLHMELDPRLLNLSENESVGKLMELIEADVQKKKEEA